MLTNKKGVMRTFEAIIAAVIMILGIAFILSDTGVTYSPNPSWEVINAKNSAEDVLVVLEKGVIDGQSEIGYYITRGDLNTLDNKLQSLIPPSYVYKFNVFELENVVYIETTGDAIDTSGILSNDYIIGSSLINNSKIWKFYESESGWPGDYIIYFPNGGSVTFYGILVVDQLTEIPGYDSVYINLENEIPIDFTSSSTNLSSTTPLRIGDTLAFTSIRDGVEYEYEYLISNISVDGNSISFALIEERIRIDFLGTDRKDVQIFDETFRLILSDEGAIDSIDIEKKIGEPDKFTSYLTDIEKDTWIDMGKYRANIVSISYDGANGYLLAQLVPFKRNIINIEKPGQIETTISAKRIVSVWDSGGVRAFYVSLIMGRQKI